MKVKILDAGFAGMTGWFGTVHFTDGVSDEISAAEAERLGCILNIETLEGVNPSATQRLVDVRDRDMAEMGELGNLAKQGAEGEQTAQEAAPVEEPAQEPVVEKAAAVELDYSYTKEQLEKMADTQGIAGLRAFAEPYGVTGRSINVIISTMLALAESKAPAVEVVKEVVIEEPADDDVIVEEQE